MSRKAYYQGQEYKAGEPFTKGGESFVIIEGAGGAQRVYAKDVSYTEPLPGAILAIAGPGYRVKYNGVQYNDYDPHRDADGVDRVTVAFPNGERAVRMGGIEEWEGGRPAPAYGLNDDGSRYGFKAVTSSPEPEPAPESVPSPEPTPTRRRTRIGG